MINEKIIQKEQESLFEDFTITNGLFSQNVRMVSEKKFTEIYNENVELKRKLEPNNESLEKIRNSLNKIYKLNYQIPITLDWLVNFFVEKEENTYD